MASSSLTTNGLLYEGSDFTGWRLKVEAVLRNRNLRDTISSKKRRGAVFDRSVAKAGAAIIQCYVSNELLDSVPHSALNDARLLMRHFAGPAAPSPWGSFSPDAHDSSSRAPTDLAVSGLLYEGSDFSEWKTNIKIILREKNLRDKVVSKRRHGVVFDRLLSTAEAAVIQSYVSKGLLDRVPAFALNDADQLLNSLATLAAPFRLLDLPAEMRVLIYNIALPEEFKIVASHRGSTDPFPALLRASSQLRNETLSIFYTLRFNYYYAQGGPGSSYQGKQKCHDKLRRLVGITGYAITQFIPGQAPPRIDNLWAWSAKMVRA